ncbi:MAG: dipeptide/oligopeptide/nickel ABC transporter permease/ATP-binding protein [Acidimicrobiia bacterium]
MNDVPRDPSLIQDPGLAFDEAIVATRTPSPFRRAFRRLLRDKPAVIALTFLVVLILAALFAPLVAPHDPDQLTVAHPFSGSSWNTPLGTDSLGRDTLSRILYGARVSLSSGFEIVIVALMFAIPIGLLAGFRGRGTDNVLMRIMDGLASFPALVLALAVVGVLGPGLENAVLAIAIVVIPGFARLIRAQTLAVRQETFIEASRSMGTKPGRVRRKRVLPNVASPLIVGVSLAIGGALIAEASLSLLGFGATPGEPSWGSMIQQGRSFVYTHPWQVFVPSIALALTILAFNTFGDGIRDALGLGLPKGKQAIKGRLGLTTVQRVADGRTPAPASEPAPGEAPGEALLSVSGLSVQFLTELGPATVVDRVSFCVREREMIGIVGESGSGKTVTSLGLMRLVPSPPGRITSGSVLFDGRDLLSLTLREMREVRGDEIAMVFQDPMTSLNPVFTIGTQLVDTIRLHRKMKKRQARARALELLEMVGIPDPERRIKDYPHQLSGGMRQRALLALALSGEPRLLIADEPTTALDVTVQAQILDLLRSLQDRLGMAVIFVTHDLGVIADLCSRVVVMYAGQVVEEASVDDLFAHPRHPYTEGLLAAIPQLGVGNERLAAIPGVVPAPTEMPVGCRFHPRCPYAIPDCSSMPVELRAASDGHRARCIRVDDLALEGAK